MSASNQNTSGAGQPSSSSWQTATNAGQQLQRQLQAAAAAVPSNAGASRGATPADTGAAAFDRVGGWVLDVPAPSVNGPAPTIGRPAPSVFSVESDTSAGHPSEADLVVMGQATRVLPSHDLTGEFGRVANNTLRTHPDAQYSLDLLHLHNNNLRTPNLNYRGVVVGVAKFSHVSNGGVPIPVAAFWEAKVVFRPAAIPPRNAPFSPTNFQARFGMQDVNYETKLESGRMQDIDLKPWVKRAVSEKGLGIFFFLEEFLRVNRNGTMVAPNQPLWIEPRQFVYQSF